MRGKRQLIRSIQAAGILVLLGSYAFSSDKREEVSTLLAETYLASGQNEKAIIAYTKIVEEKPFDIRSRMSLARLLSWEKRYGESIQEYQKIIEMDPSNKEALKNMAEVYVWRGDIECAKACYKKLIELGERNEDVLLTLAEILIWKGEYKDALEFIGQVEEKEVSLKSGILKARVLLYSGEYAEAENALEKIISDYQQDQKIGEAKMLLADTYAYSQRFKKAEELYDQILQESPGNIEVKEKLADVLSWDKEYERALSLYDEIMKEKYDESVHRQKARVLGWARRYSEAEKEYMSLAGKSQDKAASLEAEAKKAYWSGRVIKAMEAYSEVIKLEPSNVEAMFDLSQVYAYQSMWREAIDEYDRILEVNPTHFRAKEGKEKAVLISRHPFLTSRYRYFEADSQGRDMDIRVHEFLSDMRVPLDSKFFMDVEYALRGRMYRDFRNTTENEGRIKMTWLEGPQWRASGYYGILGYTGGIDEKTHLFGGNFSSRILDCGEYLFMYDREKLDNNSEVIRRNFTRNNFRNKVNFDVTSRLKAGAEYMMASYSDGNFVNEPSFDVLYNVLLDPTNLSVKYKYTYREFKDKVGEYFSPKGFSSNTFTLNWRHYLNKEERFFGSDDVYYDLKYDLIIDSEYIVGHKFSWAANWDITKKLNLNVKGGFMGSSAGVYEESEIVLGLKYYF